MAKSLGSAATLEEGTDGVTWTTVNYVKKVSLPGKVNAVDATDNNSSGTKVRLVGDSSYSFSATLNYDSSDTGQTNMLNGAFAGTTLYYRYRPRGNVSGTPQFVFQAILTSFEIPAQHESIQEFTVSGDVTAGVTKSNVP